MVALNIAELISNCYFFEVTYFRESELFKRKSSKIIFADER